MLDERAIVGCLLRVFTFGLLLACSGCVSHQLSAEEMLDLAGHSLNMNRNGWTDSAYVTNSLRSDLSSTGALLANRDVDKTNQSFPWHSSRPICIDDHDTKRVRKQKQNLETSIAQVLVKFDAHLKGGGDARIVFFIHGGLVGLQQANFEAHKVWRAFSKNNPDKAFPLFVNWDTGIFSATSDTFLRDGTVGERNRTIAEEGPRPLIELSPSRRTVPGSFLAPFRVWREFLGATGRAPFTLGTQTQLLLNPPPKLVDFPRPQNWDHVIFPREVDRTERTSWSDMVTEVFPGALRAFSPAYDFLGSGGYTQMMRRAANLVRQEADYANASYRRCSVLARLFDELRAYEAVVRGSIPIENFEYGRRVHEVPAESRISYTIVAHSLGALVADDIIADNEDLWIEDAVYLNPANTIVNFANKVIPYLKLNANFRTHIFTLHPERESNEVNLGKVVPVGSLLTWIDRFLNQPINDLERTVGDWRNLAATLTQIGYLTTEQRQRVRIVVFGQREGFPLMHGDANQPPLKDDKSREYQGAPFWRWHKQKISVSDDLFDFKG